MLIFAHRGASGEAPENTLAAIKMALIKGCDGIELDIQMTKDHKIVIVHDWEIDELSNGTGIIANSTLEELKKLDFGSHFSKAYGREKIPTLEEVLDIIPREIYLNIEIKVKSYDKRDMTPHIANILNRYPHLKNVIVSSFHHPYIEKLGTLAPHIKLAALYEGYLNDPIKYSDTFKCQLYSFHLKKEYVDETLIKNIKKASKKVFVWTVNDVCELEQMHKLGVDGIMTNYVGLMKKELSRLNNNKL